MAQLSSHRVSTSVREAEGMQVALVASSESSDFPYEEREVATMGRLKQSKFPPGMVVASVLERLHL